MDKLNGKDNDVWDELDFNNAEIDDLLNEPFMEKIYSEGQTENNNFGFDVSKGDSWIYPNNLPIRAYQISITQRALFENTLVVLPTGLGKTFIAAVIMYNFYRWYPKGKIIFMAPTRPLVGQQIEACHKIMPFPVKDTVEITGKSNRDKRIEFWKTKKVFFATPQVIQSDMANCADGYPFPFDDIKLLVFDEAHKAKGRYAYTEVTQKLFSINPHFRVLALSATPGRTMEDVAEVAKNLLISHLEVRWDSSPDVIPYVHQRNLKTVLVHLSDEIKEVREELLHIIDPYMRQLIDAEVLSGNISKINRNYLIYEQKHFKENCLRQKHPNQTAVNTLFSTCITLYHALELLERHGLRVFVNYFEEDEEGRNNFVVITNPQLKSLIQHARNKLGANPLEYSTHTMTNGEIAELPKDLDFGHPKFEEARKCLLEHFEMVSNAKAIVFCEYRESVTLMHRLLLQHSPLLKPRCFVGQGYNVRDSLKPLTQKQQVQIMNDFRSGKCNVLIATCVGEEGIDVGEVDIVVCFDISTTNPTRFIQRIGRTGRKKQGNVVMLVTEGKEQQLLKDVLSQKDHNIRKLLYSQVVRNALFQHSPRLIPEEFNPKCVHTFVQLDEVTDDTLNVSKEGDKVKKKDKEKLKQHLKGSQDLRKFFKKVPALAAEDLKEFQQPTQPLGVESQKRAESSFKKLNAYFKDLDLSLIINNTPKESQTVDTKLLKKIEKLIQRTTPLVNPSEVSLDPKVQLNSKVLSKEGKLFFLQMNPTFVADIYEKYKILRAISDGEDASPTPEEIELRKTYKNIESLFGSEGEIEKLLMDNQNQVNSGDSFQEKPNEEYEQSEKKLDEIFAKYDIRSILCDNYDFVQSTLKEYEEYMKSVNDIDLERSFCLKDFEKETSKENSLQPKDFMDPKIEETFSQDFKQKQANASTPLCVKNTEDSKIFNSKRKSCTVLHNLLSDSENTIIEETLYGNDSKKTSNTASTCSTPDDILSSNKGENSKTLEYTGKDELEDFHVDINMDDFLEPFPEEKLLNENNDLDKTKFDDSQKENLVIHKDFVDVRNTYNHNTEIEYNSDSNKSNVFMKNKSFTSPQHRKIITKSFETSPSLFDMYVKKARQRTLTQFEDKSTNFESNNDVSKPNFSFNEESVIVMKKGRNLAKRLVLESDSSETDLEKNVSSPEQNSSVIDSSIEMKANSESILRIPRTFKRRRKINNSFIDNEAVVSGSEQSEDELEQTIGCYMKDSVIVSSEDESDDGASKTLIHGMYLKSLKSPQPRRGAFKIPPSRVYNDHSRIFSQAIFEEDSEYIADSFIASDDDEEIQQKSLKNKSLCPLEVAEKVLRKRRRAKRRGQEVGVVQKRKKRRICHLGDSSDEDIPNI